MKADDRWTKVSSTLVYTNCRRIFLPGVTPLVLFALTLFNPGTQPVQAQCPPNPVLSVTAGSQGSWTVPAGGPFKIKITAKGAKGGNGVGVGGSGATMIGEFEVNSGQTLDAIAGQVGQSGSSTGAGGGGSGVRIGSTILVIAGGGGGAIDGFSATKHAGTGTSGNTGALGGGAGGVSGNGGTGMTYSQPVGGGGGLLTSGTDGFGINSGAGGGAGFGGAGGTGAGALALSGGSGFGGGGGTADLLSAGGAGGGGYSGGGAGGQGSDGGGGGSINNGTNQSNTAGDNAGGGFVSIECLGPACPPGNVLYVKSTASGANDGSSWTDAFADLQAALTKTNTCSNITEIWVAAGTYKPTNTTDRGISFVMKNNLAILGGFPNTGNPTMADRNWTTNPTILSGDIGTPNDSTDNSYHVIFNNFTSGAPLDTTAMLDGFTITGGHANSVAPHSNGGGMYNVYASPKVVNCTFTRNTVVRSNVTSTESAGGGMYNLNSSPRVTNCIFSENKARAINTSGHSYGAGMYNSSGSPVIFKCTFVNNTTPNDDEDTYGGGMYNVNCTVLIDSSSFTNNQAVFGGGIRNENSTMTLTNSTFTGNQISTYPGGVNGGAINNWNSSASISGCLFTGNAGAGAIGFEVYAGSPVMEVTRSVFTGNNYGIANQSAAPTITNCVFTGNTYGGVVNWVGGTSSPTITNCTFSENPGAGLGAISNYGTSMATVKNSILWGAGSSVYNPGGTVDISYSNVKQAFGVYAGTGNINQDPLYVNAADPDGADNLWMTADDGLALQSASPSVNTGTNAGAPATDIAGKVRPLTANDRADMGAYEANPPPFTDINAGLWGVQYSSVAWGDYDNDGKLDILLTGFDGSGGGELFSKIYHNNGDGTFTDINAGLTAALRSSVAWGDYDNDGDLDILLTGYNPQEGDIGKVYRNDNGAFTDINAGLTGVRFSSVAWGDYDNDGKLDILLTGGDGSGEFISKIYHNNGDGTFTDINAGLTGVRFSSVAWGDYDNDGDLDILLTGYNLQEGDIGKVYRNDNGAFTDINAGLIRVSRGSVAWGDYDNDGKLDILLTGFDGSTGVSKIYHNNGDGTFSDIGAGLTGSVNGSVAWGDYDNDGKLDILLTGSETSKIYRNNTPTANTVPTAPSGLTATPLSNNRVALAWSAAGDNQTPANGLSYNIRVGTTPGASNILGPMANTTNGYRRIPARGPQQILRDTLTLPPGQYYWSVQAIDAALAGGPFAAEGSFDSRPFTVINPGLTGVRRGSVAWGDYDNDGDLDILLTGSNPLENSISKLYRNDNGTFTENTNAGLTGVGNNSSAAWGDYDNDGDLDILLTGHDGSNPISKVYRNDNVAFTDINAGLTGGFFSSVAWGDYDNDGDLDILLTGFDASFTPVSTIYRNDNGTFNDISAGLTGVYAGSVAWGDYDSDGDLDILLTGFDASFTPVSTIYQNDNGTFSDINAGLTGVVGGSVAWGDYDNDGDLDILLTGVAGNTPISKVYRNDGPSAGSGWTFVDINAGLWGVQYSSVAWGDYDNDGKLDILLTGTPSSTQYRTSRIYHNDGNDIFTEINAGLEGVQSSSVAWGDYDNDGDLDILLTGNNNDEDNYFSNVYRNNATAVNSVPTAPTGLTSTPLSNNRVALAWSAAGDNQTPANGLSYNIRVGTTPGGVNVASPMAKVGGPFTNPGQQDGWRRIPKTGPKQILRDTIKVSGPGPFYWTVQAIDAALAGGPFAAEQTFTPTPPDPSGIQSDDFNTPALKPFWTFINPGNPSQMSLVGTGTADARLQFQVPAGPSHDVWTAGNMAPRVMQNCNNIDFEVEVKFDGAMTSQYQIEGIIVEESPTRFLRFDFVRDNAGTRLFAASFTGTTPTVLRDRRISNANPLWMRVKRLGNNWIQTYSVDGTNFVDFGTFTNVVLNVTKIGPFLGNAGYPEGTAPAFTGLVDYFFSTATPIVPEDGVNAGPAITQHPQNVSVNIGQTATFTVAASGTLPLGYQWQKNNTDIPGAINPSYTTPAATALDNGSAFRCVVSNALGTVTSNPAVLTVNTPPPPPPTNSGITSDDFNASTLKPFWTFINPGTPSTLGLAGTGTADALLSLSVPAGSSHDIWTGGNFAPRIMQPMNNTDFEVEVKFQAAMTAGYQIEGIIVQQDVNNYLRFGFVKDFANTRLFAASFTGGSPTVRHDVNITSVVGSRPEPGGEIGGADAGDGPRESEPSTPVPAEGPAGIGVAAIDHYAQSIPTQGGGNPMMAPSSILYLRVKRVGNTWTQSYSVNGTTFIAGPVFTHTLTASTIGPYAGNAGFPASSSPAFNALVDYFFNTASPIIPEDGTGPGLTAPSITAQPQDVTTGAGQQAQFVVGAAGSQPLQFQWQRNNADIPGAMSSSYSFTTGLGDNGAAFRCVVSNAAGTVTSNPAILTVTTVQNVSGIFSDDFYTNTLNPGWTFINPGTPSALSLVNSGTTNARLSIAVPGGSSHDLWSGGNFAPRIMQNANNTDFEIEAKFESPMTAGYQMQGIIAEESPGNYVRFGFVRDPGNLRVFGASFIANNPTVRSDVNITNGNPMWLRVKREGNVWTQSYSLNGTAFTVVGPFTHPITITKVGLYAGNAGSSPPFTMLADYFFNTAFPIVPEDGGVTRPIGGDLAGMNPADQPAMRLIPTEYSLDGNYPNPFNPTTTIRYGLPVETELTLVIYDVMGQEVRRLIDGRLAEGYHQVLWDGRDNNGSPVSSGVYIYRLQSEKFTKAQRMVLMK